MPIEIAAPRNEPFVLALAMESLTRFEAPTLFESSVLQILTSLQVEFGFSTVAITRILGRQYQILLVKDSYYGIRSGDMLAWDDAYCPHMAIGDGPPIAHNVHEIPCYANAPVTQLFRVGAYFGFSISNANGALFGTLFGVNPEPVSESVEQKYPVLRMAGNAINALIHQEHFIASLLRGSDCSQAPLGADAGSRFPTSTAWDARLEFEDAEARKLGTPVRVISLRTDLKAWSESRCNNRQQNLSCHERQALINIELRSIFQKSLREHDFFASLAADEIGLILVGAHALSNECENEIFSGIQKAGLPTAHASVLLHPTSTLAIAATQARRQTISEVKRRQGYSFHAA